MTMTLRELAQEREDKTLDHPFATRSANSRGRLRDEPQDPIRLCFQRDAHRILHCTAFRRLRYKSQVIFAPESDHVATRLDHSLYMASIAQTIARALGLNEDLAYAIALGHDLGHGPFGHAGEHLLNKLWKNADPRRSFQHELHSLRVVDRLAVRPSTRERGLNLTYEVRDGIVSHCGERTERFLAPRPRPGPRLETLTARGQAPLTMEGCVVRMADRIAYIGRDYEDACAVLGRLPPLPRVVTRVLGGDNRAIINTLVTDMIRTNLETPGRMGFSEDVFDALHQLYDYNSRQIYSHPQLVEYAARTEKMLTIIFEFAQRTLASRPQRQWGRALVSDSHAARELHEFIGKMYAQDGQPALSQIVVDYISLMTDRYARSLFEEIFLPHPIG